MILALSIVLFAAVGSVMGGTSGGGTGWEYTGDLGPSHWHEQFAACAGRMQSPINIETTDILYDPHLQYFDLSQYGECTGCVMELENVGGHTAEVKYSGEPITIKGGSLPDDYILDQFHFHWGASNDVGSEHLIDSQAAPLEMHIVHHMKKYNKTVSAQNPYGLAVLGFFFKLGEHNDDFDHLLSHFGNITHKDEHVEIEPFSLKDLLPDDARSYHRYYGSLTTPPCYETVIWTLFTEKIEISQDQLNVFRTLKTIREGEDVEVAIVNDFRPVQELHERRVMSNDKKVLHDSTSVLVSQLREEIQELKEECERESSGASTPTPILSFILVICACVLTFWM